MASGADARQTRGAASPWGIVEFRLEIAGWRQATPCFAPEHLGEREGRPKPPLSQFMLGTRSESSDDSVMSRAGLLQHVDVMFLADIVELLRPHGNGDFTDAHGVLAGGVRRHLPASSLA